MQLRGVNEHDYAALATALAGAANTSMHNASYARSGYDAASPLVVQRGARLVQQLIDLTSRSIHYLLGIFKSTESLQAKGERFQ